MSGRIEKYRERIGTIVDDRYKIIDYVDCGANGAIYKALDTKVNDALVALKVPDSGKGLDQSEISTVVLRRFVEEAQAMYNIDSPNVVKMYYISIDSPVKYMVMELLEGYSIKKFCLNSDGSPRKIDEQLTLDIMSQVLEGLAAAHSKNVIHRDIKPSNIMLCKDGRVVVIDFGIAKTPGSSVSTVQGTFVGTSRYVSPEQAMAEKLDFRTDIYSLGVTMYEMLTGQLPFDSSESGNRADMLIASMHVNQLPTPPKEIAPEISQGVNDIIMHALEKNPANRFKSATHMKMAIDALRKDSTHTFNKKFESTTVTPEMRKKAIRIAILITAAIAVLLTVIALISLASSMRIIGNPTSDDRGTKLFDNKYIASLPEPSQSENNDISENLYSPAWNELALVPSLLGLSEQSAIQEITKNSLLYKISYARSDTPSGYVISQSLPEDTYANIGTEIYIVVSSGKASNKK